MALLPKVLLFALVGAALGCQTWERFPPPPAAKCDAGANCNTPPVHGAAGPGGAGGGAGVGGSGGGGTGGTGAPTDVTGQVGLATTAELDTLEDYQGLATVIGPGAQGTTVEASYGGASGAMFSLKGVLSGNRWLFVEDDTNGATGVLSTYSPHFLPPASALVLPVVDQTLLDSIAQNLPNGPFLDTTRAQIILVVRHGGGMPASGVSVNGGATGAVVAYDNGPGIYTTQVAATGSAGVIVLLNAPPAVQRTIELVEGTKYYDVVVPTAAGAATVGRFNLE